jgi:hypothetical protein
MARGINPRTGAQLLAHGFFEEVIARLPDKKIGEAVRTIVAEKFASMKTQKGQGEQTALVKSLRKVSPSEDEVLDVRTLQGLAN